MVIKKHKNNLLIAGVAVVIAIVIGQLVLSSQFKITPQNKQEGRVFTQESNVPSPAVSVQLSKISIDFGNGKNITGEADARTAYGALQKIAKENNLAVEAKEYKYGVMVTRVGEIVSNNKYYWGYFVNGRMGEIAADRMVLKPGDKVEWKYVRI